MNQPSPMPNLGLEIPQNAGGTGGSGLLGILLKALIKAFEEELLLEEEFDPGSQNPFADRFESGGPPPGGPNPKGGTDPGMGGGGFGSTAGEGTFVDPEMLEALMQMRRRRLGKRAAIAYTGGTGGPRVRKGPGFS